MSSVGAAYSALAGRYIELFGSVDRAHPEDLAFLGRHLTATAGPVVDAGCGPGHLTGHLHSLGCEVSGLDQVPEFLAYARETQPHLHFRAGSLTEPFAEDGSLGAILAWYSLIHLPPGLIPAVLDGFRRSLRPGGVLVLGLLDGPDLQPYDHKVTTAYFWSPEGARRRLAAAGFAVTDLARRPATPDVRAHLALGSCPYDFTGGHPCLSPPSLPPST